MRIKRLITAPKKLKKRIAAAIIAVIASLSALSIFNSKYYLRAEPNAESCRPEAAVMLTEVNSSYEDILPSEAFAE